MPRRAATKHNSAADGGGRTLRERILLHPEDYLGSMQKIRRKLWVFEPGYGNVRRVVTYIPGLHRIFDEVLVFAADNKQRDPTMNHLRVEIDAAGSSISVYYNGQGIPIELHREEGLYAAEMIFGHLSSCDQSVQEISGVKLANIYSTEFIIESANRNIERKYRQVFSENMGKKSEPQVTMYLQGINWTRITFKPDLAKFNMTSLDQDFITLATKRVGDMVVLLGPTVHVVLNGRERLPCRDFSLYASTLVSIVSKEGLDRPIAYERVNDRLEVFVARSGGTFEQLSYVNKFATIEGGSHVDLVTKQIVAYVVEQRRKKYSVEEHDVKRLLWVFVNATVENPTFNSPTKEALTTPEGELGLDCELSASFLEEVSSFIGYRAAPWRRNERIKSFKRRKPFYF